MRWLHPTGDQRREPTLATRALGRAQKVLLAHVDGSNLGSWPLGGVVRREGRVFRVTRHQGVPPAPGQLDWTFDVWGVPVR